MNRHAAAVFVAVPLGLASATQACEQCQRLGVNLEAAHAPLSSPISSPVAPAYSSRPGATATLHLDLDGLTYTDEDNQWAGRTPGTVPAYDIDGDPLSFSVAELENIRQIWIRVAEAYSPFDVNVTTVDPAEFSVPRLNTRVVIGGSNAWYSTGAGGVAYVGGYVYNGTTPSVEWRTGWAFPANLGSGWPKYVADATIHEAGHQFGLSHQAEFDANGNFVQSYRRSQDGGLTAPNMGVAYAAVRGLWSDGPRAVGNPPQPQQQLDLTVLSSTQDNPSGSYWNGFGFRPDDWGDDIASAGTMSTFQGVLSSFGVIEQATDTDVFSFFARGGQVSISVEGAEFGQMLDIVLNVLDSQGQLVFTDNPPLTLDPALGYGLDASFAGFLAEGDYYASVGSNGSYGDIGQYFVSVSGAVSVPEPFGAGLLGLIATLVLRRRAAGDERLASSICS